MAGKNKEYADKYAEYAMEQMRRYGIPASVTLAQGILESSNGQSELARKENNHFGTIRGSLRRTAATRNVSISVPMTTRDGRKV